MLTATGPGRPLRAGVFAAFLLAAPVGTAAAGDIAELSIGGFSADGAYFSFEEHGRQDGSGFPYSNIYFIDTATDAWVPDSPKRALIRDESAEAEVARAEARRMARFLAQRYRTSRPGFTVATQRITQLDAGPYRVTVNPRPVVPMIDEPITFALDLFRAAAQPICGEIATGGTRGFRLSAMIDGKPETAIMLHEDGPSVPKSRVCPLDYRIHDIITFYPDGGTPVVAVLIQMIKVGFEGPDGRFLAVTGPLPR